MGISKNNLIKQQAFKNLKIENIRELMTEQEIYDLGKKFRNIKTTGTKQKQYIEKRILTMMIEIQKGILAIKRYNRKPHKKFVLLLKKIGYYD